MTVGVLERLPSIGGFVLSRQLTHGGETVGGRISRNRTLSERLDSCPDPSFPYSSTYTQTRFD